jgi:lipoprotein LprA
MNRLYSFSLQPLGKACLLGLLVIGLTLTACGGANTPTAQQLIANAQMAIGKATSYHFNLVVDHPGTGGLLTITSADGDVLVPDKLQATANTLLLGNPAKVQIIVIDSKDYATDPITGKWQLAPGQIIDPRTLSDPQKGIAAILGHIQNPSTPSDSSVDGTSCWSIDGKLDAQYLSGITASRPASAGSTVAITTCIGKADNLPYLIRVSGIAAAGDMSSTVRTFKFSKFGETLTITAPI